MGLRRLMLALALAAPATAPLDAAPPGPRRSALVAPAPWGATVQDPPTTPARDSSNRFRRPRPDVPGRSAARVAVPALDLLQVTQVSAALPTLRIFFDARTETGSVAARPEPRQVRVVVGRTPATVDAVTPFDTAEGVAYVFLVDVSRSLRPTDFEQVQAALGRWVDAFGPQHRAAVVAFGSTVRVVQDFTADKARVRAAVDNLAPLDPETRLHEALLRGVALARRADASLPARRAVVVLTDGVDDFPAGVGASEVRRDVEQDPVPLYVLGVPAPGGSAAVPNPLGGIARASGGAFFPVDDRPVAEAFGAVRERIRSGFVATASCPACPADGSPQRVQVTVSTPDGRLVNDGLTVRFAAPSDAPPSADTAAAAPRPAGRRGLPPWAYGLVAVALGAVGALWLRARRTARPRPSPPPAAAAADRSADPEGLGAPVPPRPVVPSEPAAPLLPPPADALAASLVREEAAGIAPDGAPPAASDDEAGDRPSGAMPPIVAAPPAVLLLTPLAGGEVRRIVLGAEAVIGRRADASDVVVADTAVSGRHARLTPTDAGVLLEDLGSTNGTVVNGVPLAGPRRLETGDVVRVGHTEFRIGFDAGASPSSARPDARST